MVFFFFFKFCVLSLSCSFDPNFVCCSIDDNRGSESFKEKEIVRKEMGLEWMLRPTERTERKHLVAVEKQPDEPPYEEVCCQFVLTPF